MKRGDEFTHARWLDSTNKPLRCVVTRVSLGWIYWRAVEGGKTYKFGADEIARYVRP